MLHRRARRRVYYRRFEGEVSFRVHVSCVNHGRDPLAFIDALPLEAVGEVHLAGFAREVDGAGAPLLIDNHGAPVDEAVWISLELAAPLAAAAKHLFPLCLLLGLATRFSASALLGMTAVIQLLVYPSAYATHGTWAAVLLYLMAFGPGVLSIGHVIARRAGATR